MPFSILVTVVRKRLHLSLVCPLSSTSGRHSILLLSFTSLLLSLLPSFQFSPSLYSVFLAHRVLHRRAHSVPTVTSIPILLCRTRARVFDKHPASEVLLICTWMGNRVNKATGTPGRRTFLHSQKWEFCDPRNSWLKEQGAALMTTTVIMLKDTGDRDSGLCLPN